VIFRFLKGFVAISIVIMLSGCWSRINFDQITVVSAIGLDLNKDKKLQVSVQLVNPTLPVAAGGATQQRRAIAVYTATGNTIREAIETIKKQSKKDLFFSQTRVILLSEALAKNGLKGIVDFFWREPNQNLNCWVLVTDNSTTVQSLNNSKELLAVSADEWKAYLKDKTNLTVRGGIQLYQFLHHLNQSSYEAAAPGLAPYTAQGNEIIMEIGKLAVFNGYKMSGWLSSNESQMVNWLTHSSKTGIIQVKIKKNEYIDFLLDNIHVKITPEFQNDQLRMRTVMKCDAHIETATKEVDLSSKEITLAIEAKINQYLKTEIEQTLDKIFRTYQSDVVGFGEAVHRANPGKWKALRDDWKSHLATVEIAAVTDVRLTKSGLLIDGIIEKEDRSE
jgi:spore germination protein KC